MDKIDKVVKTLNKKYKKDIIMKGTELKERDMIPFSSPEMNWLTRGGVAVGKLVEFFGGEGSGKTTSALDIVSNFQDKFENKLAVYLDAENTIDKEWGVKLGVDWERVILIQPDEEKGEILLDMVLDAVRTGEVGLVVVDSIPFLMSEQQFEGALSDKTYAGNSGLMTVFSTKIVPLLNYHNCTGIMINQIRDKIGVAWTAYNTPGGHMLKHSYVQRMQFKRGKLLDSKYKEQNNSFEEPSGNIVQVQYKKNKVTRNDRKLGTYTLMYDCGVDVFYDYIQRAVKDDIIIQSGAWYKPVDLETGEVIESLQGEHNLVDYLKENEDVFNKIKDQVDKKMGD